MMRFLDRPTRNLFFTGKGGVGKTSLACASAVELADRGRRVLIVSTDPASNLDEAFGVSLRDQPTPIFSVPGLSGMNLDPEAAAQQYRERMVGPYRGVLPDAAVQSIEEQYSGACTVEIAAFDEFAKLMGDPSTTAQFDHVVFDTAPTGHTLRLLKLPSAWSGFLAQNTSGASCLGPLAGLERQASLYEQTIEGLADARLTTLVLVTRPETSAVREAERTHDELHSLGIANQHLVINGVFTAETSSDSIATAMQQRGDEAIARIPERIAKLDRSIVPLAPRGLAGVDGLRCLVRGTDPDPGDRRPRSVTEPNLDGLGPLIDHLAGAGRGVILTMGKGGVGKTTVAAAVAVGLAERGFPVHLSTTDPAAHVSTTVSDDRPASLSVGQIDPGEVTERYVAEVMETAGQNLDPDGQALLAEDLRSPCTEEIAVFRAFAEVISQGSDRFVVLDTAPTGHTLLLLDSALAYHRDVTRQSSEVPESVQNLLPRLRDSTFAHVLVVTIPEATPVHEAQRLQDDLRRAQIEPFAWVINQSLAPLELTDPVLQHRRHHESQFLREVIEQHANRVALVPWYPQPPTGTTALRRLSTQP